MRLLGRLLTLVVIALLVAALGLFLWREVQDQVGETAARAEGVDTSVAYRLPVDSVLRYTVPPHAGTITLLFNAVVPADLFTPLDEREPLPYRVRVAVPGRDDQILNAAGRPLFYGDPDEPQTRLFLAGGDAHVTFGRAMRVDVPAEATRVAITLESAAPEIESVLLRAYVPRQLGAAPVEEQWMRLRPATRRELAADTMYPEFMLTAEERRNLLINRQSPLGPEGVADRDYDVETLYRRRDPGPPIRLPPPPPGQFADAVLAASYDVPAGRFFFRATAEDGEPLPDVRLPVTWYGERIGQTRSWSLVPGEVLETEAGLLTVAAEQPLSVEMLTAAAPGGAAVVVPSPAVRAPAYDVAGGPVTFPVRHAGGSEATLLRLDLRCRCLAGEPPAEVPVTVEELAADRTVLRTVTLRHAVRPARFELISPLPADRLSERSRHYWRLGPEVAGLRVTAESPVLAAAYNCPDDMPRRVAVPEDPHLRTWFSLSPQDEQALAAADRAPLVEIRPAPPEADPEVLEGRYVYETFQPAGRWLGRTIYQPRESAVAEREEAAPALFSPLQPGVEQAVSFVGSGAVVPTLFYHADEAGPLTVIVDGRTVQEARVRPGVGELSLGRLATGRNAVAVAAPAGTDLYLNHTAAPAALLKRTALAFEGGRLALTVPPPPRPPAGDGGDVLTLLLFTRPDAPACTVAASLDRRQLSAGGPYAALSHPVTRWQVAAREAAGGAYVLGTAKAGLAPPVRLFLPLGDDVDFTRPIELELTTDCPDAMTVVARVTAGTLSGWRLDFGPGSTEE